MTTMATTTITTRVSATLFIADIHLGKEQPQISEQFVHFLQNEAASARALYILGDLFEVWIGDDAVQPEHEPALTALKTLTTRNVPVYVMRGNRDFLMADGFEALTGCHLIDDPTTIDLYGKNTLLMHGDTLCTDDVKYQDFRATTRNPAWQTWFLGMTEQERLAFAQKVRQESQSQSQQKTAAIMDVSQRAVFEIMRDRNVTHLIHGHTHRPAIHSFEMGGQTAQRIVLGDWYHQSSYLRVGPEGYELVK